jgi:hypothetical protein
MVFKTCICIHKHSLLLHFVILVIHVSASTGLFLFRVVSKKQYNKWDKRIIYITEIELQQTLKPRKGTPCISLRASFVLFLSYLPTLLGGGSIFTCETTTPSFFAIVEFRLILCTVGNFLLDAARRLKANRAVVVAMLMMLLFVVQLHRRPRRGRNGVKREMSKWRSHKEHRSCIELWHSNMRVKLKPSRMTFLSQWRKSHTQ